jgi:hypothetical protein
MAGKILIIGYKFAFKNINTSHPRHRLKKICPASFCETCQWLKFSPEWVMGPEQGKSSGRIATFSL